MQKIISGGQTGVDRAALDAAIECGFAAGGWCPKGRKAEDGRIPAYYPLKELSTSDYRKRTQQNVIDSDGTLIIYFGQLSGGTELTHSYCTSEKKPCLLIDAEVLDLYRATSKLLMFLKSESIIILNVAGPRASSSALAYPYTKDLLSTICSNLQQET